ncbi:MAG: bacteriohemerythrin [Gammaproteobacteria bacterium]|nr:bacteriohemerythrin [Gammaproteobacteria bacterium]
MPGVSTMTDPLFVWDDSLEIGIDELDFEHKALIDDINRFHEALAQHQDRARVLGDIYARMQAHFALEEYVMREHAYEFFDEHKREHEALLDSYAERMVQFLNERSDAAGQPIEDVLERWVISHIIDSDKKMSLMIKDG